MKHLKLYEQFESSTFVGYHCSPNEFNNDFYGTILEDYYTSFIFILSSIKKDLPKAQYFIEELNKLEDTPELLHETDILGDIQHFFEENDIEWIFVNKTEPLTSYGENCYEVHFEHSNDVYPMIDELVDGADIYVYNSAKIKPVLKKYEY